ncbi:MAG TPA: helix-turn-helix domain-containing protein [Lunatimonas sp.]|nr:helix-turn-helix domain-containing protein [Lunatimonas sp.]
MVSVRCKLIVQQELEKLGIPFLSVELGMVEIKDSLSDQQYGELNLCLKRVGLEILEDKRSILIDKIKNIIIKMVRSHEELPKSNYSDYVSEKMGYDYTYLSNIFSEEKGITIQQFIIFHKIERVKEMLLYDELSLTEIAYRLNYSSVSHLSNQFKKITGLTPSYFKRLGKIRFDDIEK